MAGKVTRSLTDAASMMTRRLSVVTQAGPDRCSLWNPEKKYAPATTTRAVRMGQPYRADGRSRVAAVTVAATRNGTQTSSRRTSLCRIFPRLLRSPASSSRQAQATANPRRRWRREATSTAAAVPTTWRATMTARGGMAGRGRRNHTGRYSDGG